MARSQARLGDKSNHGGVIVTGASRTLVNGKPLARMGDKHNCPLPGHGVDAHCERQSLHADGRQAQRAGGRCRGLRRPYRDREPGHLCQLNRNSPKRYACSPPASA